MQQRTNLQFYHLGRPMSSLRVLDYSNFRPCTLQNDYQSQILRRDDRTHSNSFKVISATYHNDTALEQDTSKRNDMFV